MQPQIIINQPKHPVSPQMTVITATQKPDILSDLLAVLTSKTFIIALTIPSVTIILGLVIAVVTNWCNGIYQ